MSPEKLVRMANQIAAFFASMPREEAVAGVAEHITNFWEPRMRVALFSVLESGREDLDPLVREAAPRIRRPAA